MEKLLKFIFSGNKKTLLILLAVFLILIFHNKKESNDLADAPSLGKELSSSQIS